MTSPYHAPRLEATQPTRPGTGTWSWRTRPGPAPSFLPPRTRLAPLIPLLWMMGCWGVLGLLLIVIVDHSLIPY